jgi:hypothetical protein
MTFQKAAKKLTELVGADRFRHLAYQLKCYTDETTYAQCELYVDSGILVHGATWAEAFAELKKAMNPSPAPESVDASEAPGEETQSQ